MHGQRRLTISSKSTLILVSVRTINLVEKKTMTLENGPRAVKNKSPVISASAMKNVMGAFFNQPTSYIIFSFKRKLQKTRHKKYTRKTEKKKLKYLCQLIYCFVSAVSYQDSLYKLQIQFDWFSNLSSSSCQHNVLTVQMITWFSKFLSSSR